MVATSIADGRCLRLKLCATSSVESAVIPMDSKMDPVPCPLATHLASTSSRLRLLREQACKPVRVLIRKGGLRHKAQVR